MPARVTKVDMSGVSSKLERLKTNPTLGKYASQQAADIMQPYVPFREGALIASAGSSAPWTVSYGTPYAAYQYYGRSKSGKPLRYVKPTATKEWDKQPGVSEKLATRLNAYVKGM